MLLPSWNIWIETVKFILRYLEGGRRWSSGYDLGLPGRKIVSAKQAYNPGSNPGRRIRFTRSFFR